MTGSSSKDALAIQSLRHTSTRRRNLWRQILFDRERAGERICTRGKSTRARRNDTSRRPAGGWPTCMRQSRNPET
jgi:hypothetical protein